MAISRSENKMLAFGWFLVRLCRFRGLVMAPLSFSLSSQNLPLSSSPTTSRELLSQLSTCSGWRWLKLVANEKKISLLLKQLHENVRSKTQRCWKLSYSSEMQNDVLKHRVGLKGSRRLKIQEVDISQDSDMVQRHCVLSFFVLPMLG